MSFGFKRFLLMCIKHFHETQVTTQICYLAIMGHVRVGYLLIPCRDDSMHHAPVFCQHEMSVSRFAFNELITPKYQLKAVGHRLCLFSCRDTSCLLIQRANVVLWRGSTPIHCGWPNSAPTFITFPSAWTWGKSAQLQGLKLICASFGFGSAHGHFLLHPLFWPLSLLKEKTLSKLWARGTASSPIILVVSDHISVHAFTLLLHVCIWWKPQSCNPYGFKDD